MKRFVVIALVFALVLSIIFPISAFAAGKKNNDEKEAIDIFLFNKEGNLVYTISTPFGAIGGWSVKVPKVISDYFSSKDSVTLIVEKYAIFTGAVCLLVDDVYPVTAFSSQLQLLQNKKQYNCSDVVVSKKLAVALKGKDGILIPTNEGAAKIDLTKCSTEEDTTLEISQLAQYTFEKVAHPNCNYLCGYDIRSVEKEVRGDFDEECLAWIHYYDSFNIYTYVFDHDGTLLTVDVNNNTHYCNNFWNLTSLSELYWLPDISMMYPIEADNHGDVAPNVICLIAERKYPDNPELYTEVDFSTCSLSKEEFEMYSEDERFPFNVVLSGEARDVFNALGQTSITVPTVDGNLIVPLDSTDSFFSIRVTEGFEFNTVK